MPKIAANLNEFYEYLYCLEIKASPKQLPVVCHNFQVVNQRGQTCKLAAGYNAQQHIFFQKRNTQPPLPLYKNHTHNDSVRHRAKEVIHSQVGEVYGAAQFQQVFNVDGFETNAFRLEDRGVCMDFIIDALSHDLPVISYFDVNIKPNSESRGEPICRDGHFEHSAVIIGYYIDSKKDIKLFIGQWGEYHEVSFDALFQSTCQLGDIKSPERYEKFKRIPLLMDHPFWIETTQSSQLIDMITDNRAKALAYKVIAKTYPSEERHSIPPQDNTGSFRAIFSIMTGEKDAHRRNYYLHKYSEHHVQIQQNNLVHHPF